MATETSDAKRGLEERTLVDVDIHTSPLTHPEIKPRFTGRLSDPWRLYAEGHDDRIGGVDSLFMKHSWSQTLGGKEAQRKEIVNPEDIQEIREEFHIDYPIINSLLRATAVQETPKALDMMRAVNDLLIEDFLAHDDDLFGLISVAPQRPDKVAEEFDRLGDEGQVVGAIVGTFGLDKPLGDPRYDPMYRAAADNDLTIAFHGGAGPEFAKEAPALTWGLETYFANHALSHPWEQTLTLTSLVRQGVPVKFPDVTFVFLEAGLGWIPYMMGRLNREYSQRRVEAPLLEKSPEAYMREFYYDTQPIEEPADKRRYIEAMIDLIGVDQLVFSTDLPHHDFDNPEMMNQHLSFLSNDEKDRLFHRNAIEAFDLDI